MIVRGRDVYSSSDGLGGGLSSRCPVSNFAEIGSVKVGRAYPHGCNIRYFITEEE